MSHDVDAARESVAKMAGFDAHDNVLVIIAHDESLVDVVGMFPEVSANQWRSRGWKHKGMWKFSADYEPVARKKAEAKPEL